MSVDVVRGVLGWRTIINYRLPVWWFLIFRLAYARWRSSTSSHMGRCLSLRGGQRSTHGLDGGEGARRGGLSRAAPPLRANAGHLAARPVLASLQPRLSASRRGDGDGAHHRRRRQAPV